MRVLIAGDYSPVGRCESLIQSKAYDKVFGDIKPIIDSQDFSVVNFETTVAERGERPIRKTGPALKCTQEAVDALKWVGFDCVTLANNHFRDYGDEAVKESIEAIEKCSIDFVGGGRNLKEASNTLYKNIGGQILAVINACEHEFSIATNDKAGSNPLNPIEQYYAIKEARSKADFVVVIIHGGNEHLNLPTPRMQETYRFFVDAGADVVVNGHQHCFSGFEIYNSKPIFYGIGNFCFDKLKRDEKISAWNYGFLVCLDLESGQKPQFDLVPFVQFGEDVRIKVIKNRKSFEEDLQKLNAIIQSPDELKNNVESFYNMNSRSLRLAVEPYRGRVQMSLYIRRFLPRIAALGKKRDGLFNAIQCESHRDMLLHIFRNEMEM